MVWIDVSSAQSKLDPEAARNAGVEGAIVKISEGQTFVSPGWLDRVASLDGILLGAYHYARPSRPVEEDAREEARVFAAHMRAAESQGRVSRWDILPALDVEDGLDGDRGDLSDSELLVWTATAADELGSCMIYANRRYSRALARGAQALGTDLGLGRRPLWLAADEPSPGSPSLWSAPALWQRGAERVPWCGGQRVDLNEVLDRDVLLAPRRPVDILRAARSRMLRWLGGW